MPREFAINMTLYLDAVTHHDAHDQMLDRFQHGDFTGAVFHIRDDRDREIDLPSTNRV